MNKRTLVIVCLFFIAGTGGYTVAQRGGGGRQSPMAKLMNDLQQATPRATLSDDQNSKLQADIATLKDAQQARRQGNRSIKTRCNQFSMTSMTLWIVVRSNKQIRSNWIRTSLRFNRFSINPPLSYSQLAMRGCRRRRGSPVFSAIMLALLHRLFQFFLVIGEQSMNLAVRFSADRMNLRA
jgi:hypothetical protein